MPNGFRRVPTGQVLKSFGDFGPTFRPRTIGRRQPTGAPGAARGAAGRRGVTARDLLISQLLSNPAFASDPDVVKNLLEAQEFGFTPTAAQITPDILESLTDVARVRATTQIQGLQGVDLTPTQRALIGGGQAEDPRVAAFRGVFERGGPKAERGFVEALLEQTRAGTERTRAQAGAFEREGGEAGFDSPFMQFLLRTSVQQRTKGREAGRKRFDDFKSELSKAAQAFFQNQSLFTGSQRGQGEQAFAQQLQVLALQFGDVIQTDEGRQFFARFQALLQQSLQQQGGPEGSQQGGPQFDLLGQGG